MISSPPRQSTAWNFIKNGEKESERDREKRRKTQQSRKLSNNIVGYLSKSWNRMIVRKSMCRNRIGRLTLRSPHLLCSIVCKLQIKIFQTKSHTHMTTSAKPIFLQCKSFEIHVSRTCFCVRSISLSFPLTHTWRFAHSSRVHTLSVCRCGKRYMAVHVHYAYATA